jgi:hypothetical protein
LSSWVEELNVEKIIDFHGSSTTLNRAPPQGSVHDAGASMQLPVNAPHQLGNVCVLVDAPTPVQALGPVLSDEVTTPVRPSVATAATAVVQGNGECAGTMGEQSDTGLSNTSLASTVSEVSCLTPVRPPGSTGAIEAGTPFLSPLHRRSTALLTPDGSPGFTRDQIQHLMEILPVEGGLAMVPPATPPRDFQQGREENPQQQQQQQPATPPTNFQHEEEEGDGEEQHQQQAYGTAIQTTQPLGAPLDMAGMEFNISTVGAPAVAAIPAAIAAPAMPAATFSLTSEGVDLLAVDGATGTFKQSVATPQHDRSQHRLATPEEREQASASAAELSPLHESANGLLLAPPALSGAANGATVTTVVVTGGTAEQPQIIHNHHHHHHHHQTNPASDDAATNSDDLIAQLLLAPPTGFESPVDLPDSAAAIDIDDLVRASLALPPPPPTFDSPPRLDSQPVTKAILLPDAEKWTPIIPPPTSRLRVGLASFDDDDAVVGNSTTARSLFFGKPLTTRTSIVGDCTDSEYPEGETSGGEVSSMWSDTDSEVGFGSRSSEHINMMDNCVSAGKQLVKHARADAWGTVLTLLQGPVASFVVTKKILVDSNIGKIVGKLRKCANSAVVTAASEIIDGWRFQVSLEGPSEEEEAQRIQQALSVGNRADKVAPDVVLLTDPAAATAATASGQKKKKKRKQKGCKEAAAGKSDAAAVEKQAVREEQRQHAKAAVKAALLAEGLMGTDEEEEVAEPEVGAESQTTPNAEAEATDSNSRNKSKDKSSKTTPNDEAATMTAALAENADDSGADFSSDDETAELTDAEITATIATIQEPTPEGVKGAGAADGGKAETLGIVDPLDQCFALVAQIKRLYKQENWDALLELLRLRVAYLIATEDDLRRSDFGRVLGKVVRHAKDHRVQMAAQEVIAEWKARVGYHDIHAARETEAERMERLKFEEFMALPAISLRKGPKAGQQQNGGFVDEMEQVKARPVYTKTITLNREINFKGSFSKPLGLDISIRQQHLRGGIKAFITDVKPGGVAITAGREGCRCELNDEIIAINKISLGSLTQEEMFAKLKKRKVELLLCAYAPGQEDEQSGNTEDQNLYRFYRAQNDDLMQLEPAKEGEDGFSSVGGLQHREL